MAKNDNRLANQGIKATRRGKIIAGTVIIVLVLIVIGWFINISGLLPKVLTGVKITKNVDGITQTIDNISIAETNYHYYQVLNSYYGYGIIPGDADMDSVFNPTTGQTYREFLLDQAATELMNSAIVNEAADNDGYQAHSGASRYADINIESAESTASLYGFPSIEQYLQALYGNGMSSRILRNCIERQAYTQEYENYMRQFVLAPSEEELVAAYDANPTVYQRVDMNYYFFQAQVDEEGNMDIDAAVSQANEVAKANDSFDFMERVMSQIGEETAELAGFSEDNNPTFQVGLSDAEAENICEGFAEFLFDDAREEGDTEVFETASGAFVVRFDSRYTYDAPTVAYRTLTLYNDANVSGATPEQIAAGLNDVQTRANSLVTAGMDSLAFADLVKANSDTATEIITGGFTDGVMAARFEQTETNILTNRDLILGEWLFDTARTHGDYVVLASDDSAYVTIYYFEYSIPAWMQTARSQITTGMVNSWSNDILSCNPNYAIAYDLIRRVSN
ncbi:MAG: peptidyl-prolyl cis-trans isomerase [Saccharofermentans sp.]|nr:peptidyl-prolyl cis-trans isomerase [Saccharofermentans sp.]